MRYALLVSLTLLSSISFAKPDMSGIWQTFDDQTGYSRADVEIKRASDGSYNGKIIAIRPLPYKTLVDVCDKCKGNLKGASYIGLPILTGFRMEADNALNYSGGQVLDPLSGKIYKGKAKLSANGKQLTMRGYIGISTLGRSTTWLRK